VADLQIRIGIYYVNLILFSRYLQISRTFRQVGFPGIYPLYVSVGTLQKCRGNFVATSRLRFFQETQYLLQNKVTVIIIHVYLKKVWENNFGKVTL